MLDAARDVISGLKDNPACLAAIVLSGLFGWMGYSVVQNDAQRQHDRLTLLMTSCFEKLPRHSGPPNE